VFVTVAICTWNRAALLDRTLEEMAGLRQPEGIRWELLVVNNNCTDDTDAVAARHASRLPLRLLHEPTPGKAHAANRALAEARGELIVWTDDDVLVRPDWLAAYAKAAQDHPGAALFAGPVEPWFAAEPPRWVRMHLWKLRFVYALTAADGAVRPLGPDETPVGANMALRTEVQRQFPFDRRLGPAPGDKTNGEETDLVGRLRAAGHGGVWVGPAGVRHYIPADRLTAAYVRLWHVGLGRLFVRRHGLEPAPALWGVPRWVWRRYGQHTLRSWCYAPFKGERWLREFCEAARFRGIIEEARVGRPRPQGAAPAAGPVGARV
jgi:glycosyltransferase involved in cell wall biosynthesis